MSMLQMHHRLPAWMPYAPPDRWLTLSVENLYRVAALNRFVVAVGARAGKKTQWLTHVDLLHWKRYIKVHTGMAVMRQMSKAIWLGLEPTLRLHNLSDHWQIQSVGIRLHHTTQITPHTWQMGLIGYEAPSRRRDFEKPLMYVAHGLVAQLITPVYAMLWGRYSPNYHELTAHIALKWKDTHLETFVGMIHWTWGLAYQQHLTAQSSLLIRYHMHPILGASWTMEAIFRWPEA